MEDCTYASQPFSEMATSGVGTSVIRKPEPTMMRRVRIENIGCATTSKSLTQVLGLTGTPFLEGNCSIQMFDKNENYHAIAVPHLVANEILRGGPWIPGSIMVDH